MRGTRAKSIRRFVQTMLQSGRITQKGFRSFYPTDEASVESWPSRQSLKFFSGYVIAEFYIPLPEGCSPGRMLTPDEVKDLYCNSEPLISPEVPLKD